MLASDRNALIKKFNCKFDPVYKSVKDLGGGSGDIDVFLDSSFYEKLNEFFIAHSGVKHRRYIQAEQSMFTVLCDDGIVTFHIHFGFYCFFSKILLHDTIYADSIVLDIGARVLSDKHLATVDLYDGFSKRNQNKIKRVDLSLIPRSLEDLCVLGHRDKQFKIGNLFRFIVLPATKVSLYGYMLHLGRRLLNFFDPRVKGVIVSVVGVDGAGKSSILNEVDKKLSKGFFPLNIFYAGLKSTVFYRLTSFIKDNSSRKIRHIPAKKAQRFNVKAVISSVCITPEYFIKCILFRCISWRDENIIFTDRSYLDHIKKDNPLAGLLLRILPKPDMVIYLYGDCDILAQRKLEYTGPQLATQHEQYLWMLDQLSTTCPDVEMVKIDTSKVDIERSLTQVVRNLFVLLK